MGVGTAAICVVALAGCSAQPTHYASTASGGRFFDTRLGVYSSPRLVADGAAVPHGGGSYLIGHPYTIAGRAYYPTERVEGYSVVGTASWYGDAFHGRRTANGEIFDKGSISAAHPTLPLPSYVRVTNLGNNRSMIVRVNDRGPYHGGRVMDVSQRVAEALSFKGQGTARIRVDYIGRAGLGGSDDEKLIATLRTDGGPARLDGEGASFPTMLADALPPIPTPPPLPEVPRVVARVEDTAPLRETDPLRDLIAEARPVRHRGPWPVPPQRPYDVGADAGAAPPSVLPFRTARAAPETAGRSQAARSGQAPHLISFAPAEPEARPLLRAPTPPWRAATSDE